MWVSRKEVGSIRGCPEDGWMDRPEDRWVSRMIDPPDRIDPRQSRGFACCGEYQYRTGKNCTAGIITGEQIATQSAFGMWMKFPGAGSFRCLIQSAVISNSVAEYAIATPSAVLTGSINPWSAFGKTTTAMSRRRC